ncbi:hypothetical protein BKI52_19245 [marine bacterium AO1-C]|nr:hypothetical protein BKI52_19245 [marine bacterium AO1-C]
MNYELDIIIGDEELPILRAAGLNITIAKPVGDQPPSAIWLTFDPFEANKVQWVENYGIYASNQSNMGHGTVISKISDVFPATDGTNYTFDSSATFNVAKSGQKPGKGVFAVENQMPYAQYPALTFGLEQKATVQGKNIDPSPINAAIVPANFDVTFQPIVTVFVWLQAKFTQGTVITEVFDNWVPVQFTGSTTKQTLKYEPNAGKFVIM